MYKFTSHPSIRINADVKNIDRIDEIFSSLDDYNLKNKLRICLGYVENQQGNYDNEKCLDMKTYAIKHLNFVKENNLNLMGIYPRPLATYCGADSTNTFVIDPQGDMYKCWCDIGNKDRCVGNISNFENLKPDIPILIDYMLYDATNDEQCSGCECLPLCKGGCPNKRVGNRERCIEEKYVLKEYLDCCVLSLTK